LSWPRLTSGSNRKREKRQGLHGSRNEDSPSGVEHGKMLPTNCAWEGCLLFYVFMFLWLIFGIMFIVSFIYWLIKRKHGKYVLYLFSISCVSLIIGIIISANEPMPVNNSTAEKERSTEIDENMIVNAVEFAGIDEKHLIDLIGEPESKDEWNFTSPNGQTYKAMTLVYEQGNKEFLFIDGKVVRFTYYGNKQTYKNEKHALALFGIKPGPNITLVADTGAALRYRNVDESMKIDEFWLIEDSDSSIGTVKITYDLAYFE